MAFCACVPGPAFWLAPRKRRAAPRAAARASPSGLLAQPFEVTAVLGEGAFGEVLRARTEDRTEFCLKIARAKVGDDREASLLSELQHPHIVRLLGSVRRGTLLYLALELCHGRDLTDEIEERGRYKEAEARAAFAQIASAVAHMHDRGIAHRDLKLDNVILERQGVPLVENKVKLIDFGFATRFLPGRRNMRTKCGSEGFVAPEILAADGYDERCDVFSCGVVLHCLLCGELPPPRTSEDQCALLPFGGPALERTLTAAVREMVEWMVRWSPMDRPSACEVFHGVQLLNELVAEHEEMCGSPELPPFPTPTTVASFMSSSLSARVESGEFAA